MPAFARHTDIHAGLKVGTTFNIDADRTAAEIAGRLVCSSQSHFQTAFMQTDRHDAGPIQKNNERAE